MNKTAIKNFAIWARNKLIADISYRAGLMGITADGIYAALPQSTGQTEFYDIGTTEPYAITGEAIRQRRHLVELIQRKEKDTDYKTAYKYIIEEVAYTWFNRLIAVRFMEVNDYLPSHIRVLSSDTGKLEPDLVTTPFDAELEFTNAEQQTIIDLKNANKLDEVFRLLFIKQCNALNEILPALFEKTNDYTELLLNLSVIDQDGVVYHLVHDIPEEDFDVERGGQIEIIGWLYQYYNTALNDLVYDGNMSKGRVSKELLPAATTIYTPDWAIKYMLHNSLGKLWLVKNNENKSRYGWNYYLDESETETGGRGYSKDVELVDLKILDPCMGSGHILVQAFDMLLQMYESQGYSTREAVVSILENNLYGFDIDERAFQMAYFSVLMKARQYNRRVLTQYPKCNLIAIISSNEVNLQHLDCFGKHMDPNDRAEAEKSLRCLLDDFKDADEYGSIIKTRDYSFDLINQFIGDFDVTGQLSFESLDAGETQVYLKKLYKQATFFATKYSVVCTNPPYFGFPRFSPKLTKYVLKNYADVKNDLSTVMYQKCMTDFLDLRGYIAFITTTTWMFVTTFEKFRRSMFSVVSIDTLVDFGTELFSGKVGHNPIVAWVAQKDHIQKDIHSVRLVDYCYGRRDEKEEQFFNKDNHSYSKQADFELIEGSPIAYWVSHDVFKTFSTGTPIGNVAEVRVGLQTGKNDLFLRLWYEVDFSSIDFDYHEGSRAHWVPHNKGGAYKRWFGNNDYIVLWKNNGQDVKDYPDGQCASEDYYFCEGISWSNVSSGKLSLRLYEQGSIFDNCAPTILNAGRNKWYILGLLNTKIGQMYMDILSPTIHYTGGSMKKIPLIIDEGCRAEIDSLVQECVEITKKDLSEDEESYTFKGLPYIEQGQVKQIINQYLKEQERRVECVKRNEDRINDLFIQIYDLGKVFSNHSCETEISLTRDNEQSAIKKLISYAVGCIFGRYGLTRAGIFTSDPVKDESFEFDQDNIIPITDEQYLEDDIVYRLAEWLKVAFGAQYLEGNLDYIAEKLGYKGNTSRDVIRRYFLTDFFKDHCKQYSLSSAGKRPIYWLFDSGKQNGFKALIYLHRYNADTIGNLRIDYLHRMQRVYESEISRMQDMIDHSTNAREVGQATKRRDKLTKQLKECREYDEKLAHLALSRIELDLDDGVKVNYRKLQTANDGKFYEVLADSKNIMAKK